MRPGEILTGDGQHELLGDRERRQLRVANVGDRPIQVGSHYHFAEANPALTFDRVSAWGMRLAVPAGTSVRFEPGVETDVTVVALGGRRRVAGLRGVVGGALDEADPSSRLAAAGFGDGDRTPQGGGAMHAPDEHPEESS